MEVKSTSFGAIRNYIHFPTLLMQEDCSIKVLVLMFAKHYITKFQYIRSH